MDIKEKSQALASELGVPFEKVHLVIGMTSASFEAACSGHKKSLERAEDFFQTRENALESYPPEYSEFIREFERLITEKGSQAAASDTVGIGQTLMSGLRKGTYSGNVDEKFGILSEYFKIKSEKKSLDGIFVPVDYAPTTLSQLI